ncbi:putative sialic acid trap transporter permease protein siat [uncultured delta proteobacterium]|uniref:Putative sialic acid trap transporter permease protein siat n=1 Tax=uncultured delta proteobacterium TaxID=34034 RepID=A0A212K323_9DELT|nr:putative sialic acid trap transporter permease protein siat [uncultured delta proteobacterium]
MSKAWKLLNVFEESVMVIGMGIMVMFNFLNIICRYLMPQTPFSYTEELIVLVFVWVSMFGISYGYRRGSHTCLTIFSDMVHGKGQYVVIVFATVASALLMLLLAKTGYGMVQNQIRFNQILPGMQIPVAIMGTAVPLGAAVTLVSILRSGFLEMLALRELIKLQSHDAAAKRGEGSA